jgi:hypothetical protein
MFRGKNVLSKRVHFNCLPGALRIQIDRRNDWKTSLFSMFWVFFIWLVGLAKLIPFPQFYGTLKGTLLVWAFLVPFYIIPLLLMWIFARRAFEEETVSLDNIALSIERRTLGWKRHISAPIAEVSNLRVIKRWPDNLVRNLAFDYRGKTHYFGARVLRDEAQELLNRLGERLTIADSVPKSHS